MNFEDAMTIALAGETTRTALFDETALAQIAAAAYDTDALPLQPPFAATFDEFEVGASVPRLGTIEGTWQALGGTNRQEARFHLSGVGVNSLVRVNALWRGRIVAQTAPATGRIVEVGVVLPTLDGIDDAIVAALGALPGNPDDLEQARRQEVMKRLTATAVDPDVIDAAFIDRLLSAAGAGSVGDLLAAGASVQPLSVRVAFSPPEEVPAASTALPVAVAALARDAAVSISELLIDSKFVREQLLTLGFVPPRDPSLPRRRDVVVAWIVPVAVFDDAAWPGAAAGMDAEQARAARRQAAGIWLAREGIGLVATA